MTVVAKTDLEKALCYELCNIPKSLFETTELPHAAPKASLAVLQTQFGKISLRRHVGCLRRLDMFLMEERYCTVYHGLMDPPFLLS